MFICFYHRPRTLFSRLVKINFTRTIGGRTLALDMEKEVFNMSLVHKISELTLKHPDYSPFEWFVVGYLLAHPNNNLSLENIFTNVNNVIKLNKTGSLTSDDTNDILIKMVNNLVKPQASQSLKKRNDLDSSKNDMKGSDSKESQQLNEFKDRKDNSIKNENVGNRSINEKTSNAAKHSVLSNEANKKESIEKNFKTLKTTEILYDDLSYDSEEELNPKKESSKSAFAANNQSNIYNRVEKNQPNSDIPSKKYDSTRVRPIEKNEIFDDLSYHSEDEIQLSPSREKNTFSEMKNQKNLNNKQDPEVSYGLTNSSMATIIQKKSTEKTKHEENIRDDNDKQEKVKYLNESSEMKEFKKVKAVQMNPFEDIPIDLDDTSPFDNQDIFTNASNFSKFKKQKISQPTETKEIPRSNSESQSQPFPGKAKPKQGADKIDLVEVDLLEEIRPRQILTIKKAKVSVVQEEEDLVEEKLTYAKKPVNQVIVDSPKGSQELKRKLPEEGGKKLGLREIKELHAAKAQEKARYAEISKSEKESYSKGIKKQK